jgi:hypothetical protein
MLRARSEAVPQLSGIQRAHDIGQAFEWALDRSRITKQDAAFRMGYTDSGVIGRWISGKENLQIAKVWLIGEGFFQEFVIALAEVAKCEIETTVKIRRTA